MNQFPNYAGYPQNMHKFEERWKWRHIHSSIENEACAVWMNDVSQTKIR